MGLLSAWVKIRGTPHVNLKRKVSFAKVSSNFASFFIVMTRNSFVNFKLTHFSLWIEGSHQSQFFKCPRENLSYSWCQLPNHKLAFLQILHHFSVSWKITPPYFFRSNVIYFAQKEPVKVKISRILSAQVKIYQILVIFELTNQFFFEFWITLQCHEI